MVGEIDDSGLLPGRMKFDGEGEYPKALVCPGTEKSFISLFMMTPVSGTQSLELKTPSQGDRSLLWKARVTYPNNRLTVVVKEIAMPEASAVTIVEVPELEGVG